MSSPRRNTHDDADRRAGLLAGMRIRFKLIVLHTCFSLVLAGVLYLAIRPAIAEVVRQAEAHEAAVLLAVVAAERAGGGTGGGTGGGIASGPGVTVLRGDAAALGLDAATATRVQGANPGEPVTLDRPDGTPLVAAYDTRRAEFIGVSVVLSGAREAVTRLYTLMILALLLVYTLVAAALEVFVLPQHVYGPIRAMLAADRALRDGRKTEELVPPGEIPADELGEIMLSRNQSVLALRKHEADLAAALAKLESVATDLARKNHLLETARRNMAESDRLASLGLMSAGIAHELNTPLAVLKGMVEKVHRGAAQGAAFKTGGSGSGGSAPVSPEEAALMLRVVGRLERLSEGLLDFARVRPPESRMFALRPAIEEAWTLVRLDREAQGVEFSNTVAEGCMVFGDADRLLQVFVNLLRNAVDAMIERRGAVAARVDVACVQGAGGRERDVVAAQNASGAPEHAVSITISDTGPGIDAETMSRLFQPFVSTRLDARGTGLGLAVAEGIIREHGGVVLARNRADGPGTVFEILLPDRADEPDGEGQGSAANTERPISVDSVAGVMESRAAPA